MINQVIVEGTLQKNLTLEIKKDKHKEVKYVRFMLYSWNKSSGIGANLVPVIAYGSMAEYLTSIYEKGQIMLVRGFFKTSSYKVKNEVRYSQIVVAQEIYPRFTKAADYEAPEPILHKASDELKEWDFSEEFF